MKSGLWRAGYALGSVGPSLRLLRFATALRVTRRTPGREELSWPKASFRPSLTGSPTDGLQATRGGGSHFHRPDRSRVKTTGQVEVLMTCNLASLSGAMYHGFEGAISTFGVYFPYLNLALKWSNEPGPPHIRTRFIKPFHIVLSRPIVTVLAEVPDAPLRYAFPRSRMRNSATGSRIPRWSSRTRGSWRRFGSIWTSSRSGRRQEHITERFATRSSSAVNPSAPTTS